MSDLVSTAGLLAPSSELLGIAVAIGLIALVRLVLPGASKRLAREPTALLALHVVTRALLFVLEPGTTGARIAAAVATVLLLASIGRSAVLLVLEGVVAARLTRPMPRIFHDIIQGVVYLIMALVALRAAGVDPGSILTTSALLTAAVALSMQETLGNLVAGLAIQMQRPFDVDDWIQFDADPAHIGRVLEINWRATKLLTLESFEVIVPNGTLAKAPIINFTKPTPAVRRSIYFQAPPDVPPHVVRSAVLGALPEVDGVLEQPAPTILISKFEGGNLEYWVRYHTGEFQRRDVIDSTVRERIWYALRRAGVPLGLPNRNVRLREVSSETQAYEDERLAAQREEALGAVDFMRVLSADQRKKLARSTRIHLYGANEPIVRTGEESAEMFIVQSGEVVVLGEDSGGSAVEVARLGPGAFFGEMALMTGERTATVRAATPSTLIGVEQGAMKSLLEASPELATIISRAIAERQAARETALSRANEEGADVEERSSQLLGRIRKFFAL